MPPVSLWSIGCLCALALAATLKASGIVWSETTLRAFLKAPGDTVPGNRMRFIGLGDDRQIDDLLAYLRVFP